MWGFSKWKLVLIRVCMHDVCEMSECYLQPEPMKKKRHRQYRCISLGAQHETHETASLIITYLSVCPPQGPPVTTADVPHWQARNTHANLNTSTEKKKQHRYESDWCRHSKLSPRRYNHDDQQCGQSTGLLFYIWIPISLSDLQGSTFVPMDNLVSTPWLYVCWMWEEISRNPCDQRENMVSQRQTSFSKFMCLTYCIYSTTFG